MTPAGAIRCQGLRVDLPVQPVRAKYLCRHILGSSPQIFQDDGKRGVEFKGGSLRDGFGGFDSFGGSGEHLALLLLVLQNTGQRGNGFDGFGGCGGYGGCGRDGYPP